MPIGAERYVTRREPVSCTNHHDRSHALQARPAGTLKSIRPNIEIYPRKVQSRAPIHEGRLPPESARVSRLQRVSVDSARERYRPTRVIT